MFDVPTFTVSSVPVGVENFMTIDQIKGDFVISPLTDAHKGFFKVRIAMNLPSKPGADWFEFDLNTTKQGRELNACLPCSSEITEPCTGNDFQYLYGD
jgi:hypothetical protein